MSNRESIPEKIQVEILLEAVFCIMSTFCKKLGLIKTSDINRAENHPFNFGSLSVSPKRETVHEDHFRAASSQNNDANPTLSTNEIRAFLSAYNKTHPNSIERNKLQVC